MKPYYDDGRGIVIYNCDCRAILPSIGKFDLLLTDPPYGMEYRSNFRIVKHDKIHGDIFLPLDLIEISLEKATRAAYVFCRWDNLSQMPAPKSVLAWVKNNWSMGDLEHEHGRQWEAICFYPKENHKFVTRIPDVIMADRTGNNLHPTEKPVGLIGKIIASNECQTILDPFAGSGTTGRAAKDLGKQCTMIEREEKYCEIAAKRMAQEVLFA